MEPRNPICAVKYLRLDFHGNDYKDELDEQVRTDFLQSNIDPIVRGQTAPAAGAGLVVDIVISLATGILTECIIGAFKNALRIIQASASKTLSTGCELGRTTIELDTCDFVITANASAGIYADGIDYDGLVSQMRAFCQQEAVNGLKVIRIEAPCDIYRHDSDRLCVQTNGVGSFSLWRVSYSDGERWPLCLYDAANDTLLPMDDDQTIMDATTSTDIYYHPPK